MLRNTLSGLRMIVQPFQPYVDRPAGQVGHHGVLVGRDPLHLVPLGTGEPGVDIVHGKF